MRKHIQTTKSRPAQVLATGLAQLSAEGRVAAGRTDSTKRNLRRSVRNHTKYFGTVQKLLNL